LNRINPLALFAACALVSGCGHDVPDGRTWLALNDGDTLFLEDAVRTWQGFTTDQQDYYLEVDSAGVEFVKATALRGILEEAAADAGYLEDPLIVAFGRSWLRNEASKAYTAWMCSRIETQIDPSDVGFCVDHYDDSAWITASTEATGPIRLGQFSLPGLPHEFAILLDSMEVRDSAVEYEGVGFWLDSIARADSSASELALRADGLPDSTSWWVIAQSRIRFWNLTSRMRIISDCAVTVDTSAIDRLNAFYGGTADLAEDDAVVRSSLGNWTSLDLTREIEFFRTVVGVPLSPDQKLWVLAVVDNVLMQSYSSSLLAEAQPSLRDSLETEAHVFVLGLAVDSLRRDSVLSGVTIAEDDLQYELDQLDPPAVIPELRILRAVLMPPDAASSYERAVEDGSARPFISALPVIPAFAENESSRITRPLRESELPPGHGEPVFAAAPGDSSWIGPLFLDEARGSAFYKVVEVLPERPATVDDLRPQLVSTARARHEMEATDRWLRKLSDEHGLRLNLEALDRLPDDPGEWGAFL
jgi:hypothetical protein